MIGSGKDGNIYVVDTSNMGKFNPTSNNIYQELAGAPSVGASSGRPSRSTARSTSAGSGQRSAHSSSSMASSRPRPPRSRPTPSATRARRRASPPTATRTASSGRSTTATARPSSTPTMPPTCPRCFIAAIRRPTAATRSARRTNSSHRRSPMARSTWPRLTESPSLACCRKSWGSSRSTYRSAFNRTGITVDGTKFRGGGLDRHGHDLSSNLLGASLTAAGATFDIGPAAAPDVVSAARQTIDLPAGNDAALKLLATAVNRNQPRRTFTVAYTDGTRATFKQSISNWATPKRYAGESTALLNRLSRHVAREETARAVPRLRVHVHAGPHQDGSQPHPAQRRQRRGARRHAHPRGHDASESCSDLDRSPSPRRRKAGPLGGPASLRHRCREGTISRRTAR